MNGWKRIKPGDPAPTGLVALAEVRHGQLWPYGLVVNNWDGEPVGIEDGRCDLKPQYYLQLPMLEGLGK